MAGHHVLVEKIDTRLGIVAKVAGEFLVGAVGFAVVIEGGETDRGEGTALAFVDGLPLAQGRPGALVHRPMVAALPFHQLHAQQGFRLFEPALAQQQGRGGGGVAVVVVIFRRRRRCHRSHT